jgi:hypothetical protein
MNLSIAVVFLCIASASAFAPAPVPVSRVSYGYDFVQSIVIYRERVPWIVMDVAVGGCDKISLYPSVRPGSMRGVSTCFACS